MFCCFGVCLRKSARSAGDFGVSIEYSYVFIFPQIAQITQTNTAELYYSAEKDRLFEVKDVLLFVVCCLSAQSARSAGDFGV